MPEELLEMTKEKMAGSLIALTNELKKVRTGRAQISMLDNVKVDYYGTPTPLSQVATLSCPDAKTFVVAPWEATLLKEIESSIVRSDIGMSPQNDGKLIRLRLPDLTEARRIELVKTIKKIIEDARISVRMARKESNDTLKKDLKDKTISEDDQKKMSDSVQKLTDEYIKKIDGMSADKEKELMTV